ncbi:VanW family protein [Candidatus Berkelbacteria bacterium]|nr:VanW family protein [Candidatus Berkelbacteria bacterium]
MVDKNSISRRTLRRWIVGGISALLGVLVFAGGIYGFYTIAYADSIFPNTYVGPVSVGAESLVEAETSITRAVQEYQKTSLKFAIENEALSLALDELSVNYDALESATLAYGLGRTGSLWENLLIQVGGLIEPNTLELRLTYNEENLNDFLELQSTKFDEPEQNATIAYIDGEVNVVPEMSGQRFDQDRLRAEIIASLKTLTPLQTAVYELRPSTPTVTADQVKALLPMIERVATQPLTLVAEGKNYKVSPEQLSEWLAISKESNQTPTVEGFFETNSTVMVGFDQEKIQGYLKTIATEINQDPVDARLTIKDGRASVFQTSKDGKALDLEKASAEIIQLLEVRYRNARTRADAKAETLTLPVKLTKPIVNSSTVDDLGIKELIGKGTTDFSGSPNNRVHNLANGTKFLSGILVKPGEEFSTVKALGAVDASTGYLPELVIKENRTIPEYGGGLCQVSTTLFRAILDAGLKVTERKAHSYRVSYYERNVGPGLDATVYLPKPDLKFLNDTPGWILVQGYVTDKELTFELYGTSDGRTAKIDGPQTLSRTPPPADVYETSSSLAPGEVKQIEKPHEGARTTATYTVMRNGEVINSQTFTSSYKALPARFLKGPDQPTDQPSN